MNKAVLLIFFAPAIFILYLMMVQNGNAPDFTLFNVQFLGLPSYAVNISMFTLLMAFAFATWKAMQKVAEEVVES